MAPDTLSMPILIVSIHRRERGLEVIHDFLFTPASGLVCDGCGNPRRDTLSPAEMIHDDADSVSRAGAALCKACCLILPLLQAQAWPALTAREVEVLWQLVRQEQIAQAQEPGRADSPASSLQGFDGALTASQQAAVHQGVDRFGKVA